MNESIQWSLAWEGRGALASAVEELLRDHGLESRAIPTLSSTKVYVRQDDKIAAENILADWQIH